MEARTHATRPSTRPFTCKARESRDSSPNTPCDGHDAEHVQDAIISKMRTLPALPRNSPAWDQGPEPAPHTRVSAAPGMQVHFRDPRNPRQRGANENTNGLPRQHSP